MPLSVRDAPDCGRAEGTEMPESMAIIDVCAARLGELPVDVVAGGSLEHPEELGSQA